VWRRKRTASIKVRRGESEKERKQNGREREDTKATNKSPIAADVTSLLTPTQVVIDGSPPQVFLCRAPQSC
jgi:hypothetical protein